MTTFNQLPGVLNLEFVRGDEFGTSLNFDLSMAGYTVAAELLSAVSGSKILDITTTVTNAAAGQVSISLTETQTAAIPVGTYRWILYWDAPGAVRRTVFTGFVEAVR